MRTPCVCVLHAVCDVSCWWCSTLSTHKTTKQLPIIKAHSGVFGVLSAGKTNKTERDHLRVSRRRVDSRNFELILGHAHVASECEWQSLPAWQTRRRRDITFILTISKLHDFDNDTCFSWRKRKNLRNSVSVFIEQNGQDINFYKGTKLLNKRSNVKNLKPSVCRRLFHLPPRRSPSISASSTSAYAIIELLEPLHNENSRRSFDNNTPL